MQFAFNGTVPPVLESFASGLRSALLERGYEELDDGKKARLVVNFIDRADARPFRRIAKSTFVASVWAEEDIPQDFLAHAYPVLVRALSNLVGEPPPLGWTTIDGSLACRYLLVTRVRLTSER